MTDKIEVTEADREAVKALYATIFDTGDGALTLVEAHAQAFALYRTEAERRAQAPDDWVCEGIPANVIEAGIERHDNIRTEMQNYVSGVSTDWDEGMIVCAIFKTMLRAALGASNAE